MTSTRSPIHWPETLRAHEALLGIHIGFYDFKGRLRPLVGEAFLNHRAPVCLRAKASGVEACKHFEGQALARAHAPDGVLWKCCHLGVMELLFELRSPSGLEGALFAGPFSPAPASFKADVFRPPFPSNPLRSGPPRTKTVNHKSANSSYLHVLRPLVEALEESLGRIPSAAGGRREDQVRHYLAKHYASPEASVAGLASTLGLSPSATRAWLQKYFKKGFNELLTLRRMEMAELLLRWGDESMEAIALQVGYEHARSFDKAFRRTHGTSPGRFRERTGKTV